MTVVLTSPVEGKQPGDTYTGANEAYLLASGYAEPTADADYTGPGAAPEGPADVAIASNREFDATRGDIAHDGGTPEAGTNDGDLKLGPADAPYTSVQGGAFGAQEDTTFNGFANDPEGGFATEVNSISPATGPAVGGTVVTASGRGLEKVTGVTVDGVAATAVADSNGGRTLVFTTPAGTTGPADVVYVTAGDDVTKAASFTYGA